jgi:hypothetical protein
VASRVRKDSLEKELEFTQGVEKNGGEKRGRRACHDVLRIWLHR